MRIPASRMPVSGSGRSSTTALALGTKCSTASRTIGRNWSNAASRGSATVSRSRGRARRGESNAVAERRPRQATRARAAVIPLQAGADRIALARLLPSGRSLAVGFAIVLGAAGLYALARATPIFALRRIEVEGVPPAIAARVRAALEPLDGTSLLALKGAEVERRLAALTVVASATYDRDFPHTLRVVVRPEHPVAVVRHGADGWIVAASGRVIAATDPHAARSLPRIWIASDAPHVGAP